MQRFALDAEVSLEATTETHSASRRALLFLAAATATTHAFAATATTQPDIQQLEVCSNLDPSKQRLNTRTVVGVAALAAFLARCNAGSHTRAARVVLPTPHTQVEAYEAYANREFSTVLQKLAAILSADPDNPRWYEMRAQVGPVWWGPSRYQGICLHRCSPLQAVLQLPPVP